MTLPYTIAAPRYEMCEIVLRGPPLRAAGGRNPSALRVDIVLDSKDGGISLPPGFDGAGECGRDGNARNFRFPVERTATWTRVSDSDEPSLH